MFLARPTEDLGIDSFLVLTRKQTDRLLRCLSAPYTNQPTNQPRKKALSSEDVERQTDREESLFFHFILAYAKHCLNWAVKRKNVWGEQPAMYA